MDHFGQEVTSIITVRHANSTQTLPEESVEPGFKAREMLAAAFRGDAKSVRDLLEDGADINWPDGKWGTTPLMAAAAPTQRLEVLKVLLCRKDLNKDSVNQRGMTALHQAAWYGQKEAVRLLLTMGASEDPKTEDGLTASEIARRMGHEETAELFAEAEEERRKANIESADALRARLKSQNKQRSAKALSSLISREVPPPLPLYKPSTPEKPAEDAAPIAIVAAEPPRPEEEEEEVETKRPQFEGAGGGGPMKKWNHDVRKAGGGRQNKENEQVAQGEGADRGPARSREERAGEAGRGPQPKAPERERGDERGRGSERGGAGCGDGEAQGLRIHREMPAVLAAAALELGGGEAPKRLNMGKSYQPSAGPAAGKAGHRTPEDGETEAEKFAGMVAPPRPRAHSSMQLSSTSNDSDFEGSFFLTQKPPSRPVSGVVRR